MVNKADLAAEVAERLNGADPDARQYVDAVFDVIMSHVAAGERVQILGFGTFDSVERAARVGRNPRTGAAIQVPAGVAPRFHAGQTFRTQVSDGSPVAAAPVVADEAQQDVAKPAEVKKSSAKKSKAAAEKKTVKAVAEKPAKVVAEKPAKVVAEKPAKVVTEKPAKAAKKKTAKAAAEEKVAKPAQKKQAKTLKEAKKPAKKPAKTAKAGKK